MEKEIFYSRTPENQEEKRKREWEHLDYHLQRVAELAFLFAKGFCCGDAGCLLGILHDGGKNSTKFQQVLKDELTGINHEATGALFVLLKLNQSKKAKIFSDVIFAHHKGLMYHIQDQLLEMLNGTREYETRKEQRMFSTIGKEEVMRAWEYVKELEYFEDFPQKRFPLPDHKTPVQTMLLYRMLLSSLVDADYCASAEYNDKDYLKKNTGAALDTGRLVQSLEDYVEGIRAESDSDKNLNEIRNNLYSQCVQSAEHLPGLFTLTAPTGTGKTLALLAFAAYHARKYDKKRIIIVLPLLSIITQNAGIYRKIYHDILEIHSHTEIKSDQEIKELSSRWSDGFIITTSVQFFEALFAHKPSDCRKLHHFADSVIVFDEAQSLPAELLLPTLEAVQTLCETYHSTVVFSTATQPDYSQITEWKPYEIVQDIPGMYLAASRNQVEWDIDRKTSWEEIAERMAAKNSVCCIVNLRSHAHKLFGILSKLCPEGSCFHISTDMCVEHREDVIKQIETRLDNNLPCYVVSTSCIEAGVDLDFGYMFRALAPLEAIIQAIGRCNRNGKGDGGVCVFVPEEEKLYPQDWYEHGAMSVKTLRSHHEIDICNAEHIREYYKILFQTLPPEKKGLKKAVETYDFEKVDQCYKLIDNNAVNILVPYEQEIDRFEQLREEVLEKGISPAWIKRATALSVTSYKRDKVGELCEPLCVIKNGKRYKTNWYVLNHKELYNEQYGFHPTDHT